MAVVVRRMHLAAAALLLQCERSCILDVPSLFPRFPCVCGIVFLTFALHDLISFVCRRRRCCAKGSVLLFGRARNWVNGEIMWAIRHTCSCVK